MIAYFISGLGADERMFDRIRLPEGYSIVHLPWLEPEANETLSHYVKRMGSGINTSEDFILLGVSFGGIVSIELSKFLKPRDVIIISTVASDKEFPLQFRLIRMLRLQKIVPFRWIKAAEPILYWFFSAFTEKEKRMLHHFLKTVSVSYMHWAMDTVLNWKNDFRPPRLYHLHGTADHIFPIWRTHADVRIKGGGHFMVFDRATEINALLAQRLSFIKN